MSATSKATIARHRRWKGAQLLPLGNESRGDAERTMDRLYVKRFAKVAGVEP